MSFRVRDFIRTYIGTISGWYQQGCGAVAAVVCVPLLIKYIGGEKTGIWLAFISLAALANLADFGFGYVTSRQVAFSLGGGGAVDVSPDIDATQVGWQGVLNTLKMARFLNFWSCVLSLILMVGVGFFIVLSGKFTSLEFGDLIIIWCVLSVAAALMMLSKPDIALLEGVGQLPVARFVVGTQTLLSAVGVCAVAICGGGLVLMALVFCLSAALSLAVLRYWSNFQFNNKILSLPFYDHKQLKKMVRVAFPLGLVNLGSYLFSSIQVPIIAVFLSPAAVSPFYMAQRVGQFLNMLVIQVLLPRLPEFSSMLGRGDRFNAKMLMSRVIAQVSIFSVFICVFYVVAFPFLAKHIFKIEIVSIYFIGLMAIDYLLVNLSVSWGYFVISSGCNPFLISTLLTGLGNLVIMCLLIPPFGLLGLPLSSLVSGVMFSYWYNVRSGLRLRASLMGGG